MKRLLINFLVCLITFLIPTVIIRIWPNITMELFIPITFLCGASYADLSNFVNEQINKN